MKIINRLFVPVLIFWSLFFFNAEAQMMTMSTLKGHVYSSFNEESRTPIANANISLQSFSMMGDSVLYSATSDSTGAFQIDSVKGGIYTLICSASGYNNLVIREFEVSDFRNSITLILHDTTQVQGGLVSGSVNLEDSMGMGLHAVIEFINLDNTSPNIFATTNMDGHFSVKVPSGQYYATCTVLASDSSIFFQQYYQNASTLADAKVITVNNGQEIEDINFQIPQHAANKHTVTFQGSVQSSLNIPIAGADIKVWASGREDDEDRMLVGSAKSDSNGNYSITFDSVSFSAFIVAAHKDGYRIQFYDTANAFFKAQVLAAVSDTTFSNINFTLSAFDTTVQRYSISGSVTDSAGTGIRGAFVVAFDSANGHTHVGITDSTGNYSIPELPSGTYFVMFHARGYVSQFYMNADKWENATSIALTSSVTGINASLKSESQSTIGGSIIGQIHSDNGTAIAGALITISDSHGQVIGTAVTDANGSYTIQGVPQGSYTITASITQYSSQQTTTSYDPSAGSTTVNNFTMSPSTVTSVETAQPNLPTKFVLQNNYPNPFNPSTIISFEVPFASHVKLDVYNILGQKVAELVNKNLSAGNYQYSFNANNLSSGVYLYRIEANGFTATKKMILTK